MKNKFQEEIKENINWNQKTFILPDKTAQTDKSLEKRLNAIINDTQDTMTLTQVKTLETLKFPWLSHFLDDSCTSISPILIQGASASIPLPNPILAEKMVAWISSSPSYSRNLVDTSFLFQLENLSPSASPGSMVFDDKKLKVILTTVTSISEINLFLARLDLKSSKASHNKNMEWLVQICHRFQIKKQRESIIKKFHTHKWVDFTKKTDYSWFEEIHKQAIEEHFEEHLSKAATPAKKPRL